MWNKHSIARKLLVLTAMLVWVSVAPKVVRADYNGYYYMDCYYNPDTDHCRGLMEIYGFAYDQSLNYLPGATIHNVYGALTDYQQNLTPEQLHDALVGHSHFWAGQACLNSSSAYRSEGVGASWYEGVFQEEYSTSFHHSWQYYYCCSEFDVNC